ncbi:MAG: 4Fe-4S dicluster domain-containing protein [Candidatus Hydrogenedentes bacterium]|nr:4Fe-4S dicluster domain-containing protein [Candidatus Hydrogenedentota bacterium]
MPLNEIDIEAVYGARRRMDANSFTVVNRFGEGDAATYVKRQCMHCVDPACVSACPVKAFVKPAEGAVTYNEDLCMGCRYCMVACPFDVPAYEYDNPLSPRVRKCTMCFERFESGGAAPACASICPQEAITYGKREDLLALARQKFQNAPGEYVDHIYGEREAGGTNWLYISKKPFEELGFNCGLGDKPYPDLTKGYLAMVPLVHSIWPMLLMGLYAFSSSRDQAAEPGQHGEEEVER